MRRALALATCLTLTVASSAQAGWRINRAEQIAAIVWNHPCNDHVLIIWEINVQDDAHEAAAWADVPGCTIHINANFWNEPHYRIGWSWPLLCTTILHEYGHLAGFRDPLNPGDPFHSRDPTSIMYSDRLVAVIDDSNGRHTVTGEPRCNHQGRPFLVTHGLLQQSDPTAGM